MIPQWVTLLTRILNGVLDALNRKKKKDAVNNPADTLANGGSVQSSEKTFADLSAESKRDKTK